MEIGLNSGTFLSGNVRSERRLEYAAIGDTTNTAARLEGMTKGNRVPVLRLRLDAQRPLWRDAEDLVVVNELEIRRQAKIKLWALPNPSHLPTRSRSRRRSPPSDPTPRFTRVEGTCSAGR